ncbi:MAG: hypothetical protein ACPG88_11025, partial [Porticoccaceae bacterium]
MALVSSGWLALAGSAGSGWLALAGAGAGSSWLWLWLWLPGRQDGSAGLGWTWCLGWLVAGWAWWLAGGLVAGWRPGGWLVAWQEALAFCFPKRPTRPSRAQVTHFSTGKSPMGTATRGMAFQSRPQNIHFSIQNVHVSVPKSKPSSARITHFT